MPTPADIHEEWLADLPAILFQRPGADPWQTLSPQGGLLPSFGCAAHEFAARLQQSMDASDRQRLAGVLSKGEDYTIEYTWGSRRLEERGARCQEGFSCLVIDVSHRQPVENLALLAQSIPEPVSLISKDHRYLCVNRAWREVFGQLAAEPEGSSLEEVWGIEVYRNNLKPLLCQAFAGRQLQDEFWSEAGVLGRRCRSLNLTPCMEENGQIERVIVVTRDITELKQTRQALHRSFLSAQELRDQGSLALRVAEIGTWGFDFSTSVVCWDEGMYKIYGHSPETEVTLERWRQMIHPEDRHHLRGFLEHQKTNQGRQVIHFRIVRQDGELRFIKAVFGIVLDEEGAASGLVGANIDVTELQEAQEALRRATHVAQEANRAKSQFLATMSHEIRTPMNAILGLVHLVRLTELTPRQDDYLQKLERSARSLLDIINDILDFSKIEAGKLSLECLDFRLGEVLDNLGQVLQVRAKDKPGLEVLLSVEPDVPDCLRGDPLRLGQVLLNLGGNAVKFTEFGEIIVSIRCLHREADSIMLEFTVTDTGIGLLPEQMPTLFQPFAQADSSTARKFGGTGLGLSISRQLVELMGGQIWAEGANSGGARFVFTARFLPASPQTAAQDRNFPQGRSNLRVLIVDDGASARRILAAMIQGFGFRPDLTESGEEAVRMSQDQPYDLILMDWRLPGIHGIEASRRIRSQSRGQEPVILLVTAYDREDLAEQMEEAVIDGMLRKPVSESNLYDAIATAFHRRDQRNCAGEQTIPWTGHCRAQYQGRVLLVEDNEINQQVAGEMLALQGLEVRCASCAPEALDCLREQAFDLVFMDVQMPGVDGLEATRRIRANPQLTQIPIVAMTANCMMGDRERCLQAGMTEYLSKPIDPQALQDILEKYLESTSIVPGKSSEGWRSNPSLDTRAALDRLGGNRPLYLKLLARFQDQHRHTVESLSEFLRNGNLTAARGLAHTLKGTAANLGMTLVAQQAQVLEYAIKSELPELQTLLPGLQKELEIVLQSVQSLTEAAPRCPLPGFPPARELKARLIEMGDLIRLDIGRALALSQRLTSEFAGHPLCQSLNELQRLLHEFANEEAEAVLRSLLEKVEAPAAVPGRTGGG